MTCPCGAPRPYEDCCGKLHAGALADTPEQLMRSRYSAFVKGDWPYLARTQVAPFDAPAALQTWVGLTVHEAKGDEVEFTARWLERDREVSLHERSRFERKPGGGWLYTGGTPQVTARKVGRNDQCPCGSGKKLKACHA